MIGAGATVLPDIRIGEGAIVAGGSLVRRHVEDGAFVAGNPALPRPFDPKRSSLHVEDGE
jgi:acetyltransferase-like isoleucine patch superfamily enzyme